MLRRNPKFFSFSALVVVKNNSEKKDEKLINFMYSLAAENNKKISKEIDGVLPNLLPVTRSIIKQYIV